MNICIFGSRSLKGDEVQSIIWKFCSLRKIDSILTAGETNGVCLEARKYAEKHNIPLVVEYLDYKKNGKGAPDQRSKSLLKKADLILFIYDGKSKGTKHEIELAVKMKKEFILTSICDGKTTSEIKRELFDSIQYHYSGWCF
jgi:CO dehydrogenase/acetyl-CoA synthase epsilon subunit